MQVCRGEPLQVIVGEPVLNARTGEQATVTGVDREGVRLKYADGREECAPRLNYYLSPLEMPRTLPALRPALAYAGAYRFPDRLVLHAEARIERGQGGVAREPYFTLSPEASLAEVGSAVLAVLAAFHPGLPTPTVVEREAGKRAFLKGLRVSSVRKLQQAALGGRIREHPDRFELVALHNGGTRGDAQGFSPQHPLQWIVVPKPATAEELGAALIRCFELCTTIYPLPLGVDR